MESPKDSNRKSSKANIHHQQQLIGSGTGTDIMIDKSSKEKEAEVDISNTEIFPISPAMASYDSLQEKGNNTDSDSGVRISADDDSTKDEIRSILEQFDPLAIKDDISKDRKEEHSVTLTTPERPNPTRKPSRDPEPPFDFNRFLEQMRQKSADPIAKYLKSFLREFGKKRWTTNEQIKIVTDFLDFIIGKMQDFEPWKSCSEAEFENAKEGIEKLVMNRLYSYTFTPAIHGLVTTDDREKDEVIKQKIEIFSWIKEEHLDIPHNPHNPSFLSFAQQELIKINHYKAPRDKLICILNCCKVIFGLIRHVDGEESADKFIPLLIYVVLRANPDYLISNVQYINRFRSPEKLESEAGYYLSSLMGAISFIETMDTSSLSIDKEEFERNVERSISEIAKQRAERETLEKANNNNTILSWSDNPPTSGSNTPRSTSPMLISPSLNFFQKGQTSLQRTLQKPLSVVGRIFSDSGDSTPERQEPPHTAPPILERRRGPQDRINKNTLSDFDSEQEEENDTMQFEAERINTNQYQKSVETLKAMFPNVESEVVSVIFEACDGLLATAIDTLLEVSGQTETQPINTVHNHTSQQEHSTTPNSFHLESSTSS